MPLPKIEHPLFELTVPSTKQKIKVRQMLVKEEKILLMAKEANTDKDIMLAIKQVVNNCIQTPLDINKLTIFDLEYLFIKLRALSIDNIVKVSYRDGEDQKIYDFEIDLNSIEVKWPDNSNSVVMMGENKGIELAWPTLAVYSDQDFFAAVESGNEDAVFDEMVAHCFKNYFEEDKFIKPENKKELKEFIDSLDIKTYNKIREFFAELPTIYHELKYVNSNGNEQVIKLSSLNDFFTL